MEAAGAAAAEKSGRQSASQQSASQQSASQQPASQQSASQQPASQQSADQKTANRDPANQDLASQETKSSRQTGMGTAIFLALIVAAGFSLRLYQIGNHGLFVDEVYSVLVAGGHADPELVQFDATRPVYFWLLKAWMLLSSSEVWMRFLSVIFGTANIALVFLTGKLFAGRKVGLASALLLALSPMEIHYSQQVRMYTMGSFLVLGGTIALLKAYGTEQKKWLAAWAAIRLIQVLTLPLTGMLLVVDGIYAWSRRKSSKLLRPMALYTVLVFLALSPFIYKLTGAYASEYDAWRCNLDAPDFIDLTTLLINFTSSAIPLQESGGPPAFDWFTRAYIVDFLAIFVGAGIFAFKERKMLWCCAYGLAPLGLIFLYSNIDACLLITRYVMFTAPFVFIFIAFGWAQTWTRLRPAGFLAAAVYLLAMTSCLGFFYSHPVHEDWHLVGNYLTDHVKPGDEIVVWNYHSRYLIGYYYHGSNHISDMRVSNPKPKDGDPDHPFVDLEFVTLKPKAGQRIWLVSREAAQGWTSMHAVYGLYKEAIERRFKVLGHDHQVMTDIYEVVQP